MVGGLGVCFFVCADSESVIRLEGRAGVELKESLDEEEGIGREVDVQTHGAGLVDKRRLKAVAKRLKRTGPRFTPPKMFIDCDWRRPSRAAAEPCRRRCP